jgi:hypothetical protein
MEVYVNIKFTSPEQDVEFWAHLAEGLCDHKRGAWLEEQFDRFGEQASSLITEIMDECDKSNAGGQALIFESWERDGNQFEACINGGWIIFDLLPRIRELLELCGVQDLYMDDPEDNEC